MHLLTAILSIIVATTCAHDVHDHDMPPPVAINDMSYTSCANAAWPPSNVGTELIPQKPTGMNPQLEML